MPLYQIQTDQNDLKEVKPSTFAEVQMRERQELQALLLHNPEQVIAADILIFAEEFSNWQESLRRVDLLGLDKDANLIVIELKRVEDGGHMELQAVRYAAMLSGLDFEAVVTAYEKLLSKPEISQKRGIASVEAREDILNFLEVDSAEDVTITSNPRIFLLSPSFSKEITTTVLWLNDRGLDIRCLEINPYRIENGLYLNVEQVIPLPSASTYIVQQREKATKVERQVTTKRREKSITTLVAQRILQHDTPLYLIKLPRPNLNISDESAKHAVFLNNQKVRWNYDGNEYSLSGLCKAICETFGGAVGTGAFAGPDYWAIEGDDVSLSERAMLSSASLSRTGSAEEIELTDEDEEALDRAWATVRERENEAYRAGLNTSEASNEPTN